MLKTNLKDFFKKHWLVLAPMAGVNDIAFRELCINYGAKLTYTEMISSKGLDYYNPKTLDLLRLSCNETEVVVQLFGHEPKIMAKQARYVSEKLGKKLAYIDINMGCPAKKIVKKGDGAALMQNVKLASEIVKVCSEHVVTSVKFRKCDKTLDFAESMQKAGANALCLHGRYQSQFYKGKSDWNLIKSVWKNASVPVIGSGDVCCYSDAEDRLSYCDAVMIGRAARGNPYVFSSKKYDNRKLIIAAKKHLKRYNDIYGNNMSHMRKHCMWYVKGMKGASVAREKFGRCSSLNEFLNVFEELENYERV